MPMSRYEIRNEYSLADPELYRAADKDDPEALLEGVAMAGLVGVLRQLGDLAEFAAEIFHDLHEEVMATSARGHGLMIRVQQLESEIPSIEKAFLSQTDHSSFFYSAGVDWRSNLRLDQNLVTQGDLPRFIMDSYEECRGPPRLFLLDKFDDAGAGACLKRYTDPSFFKVETYGMTSADVQREKKIRKTKKKGPRWRNGGTPEVLPSSHAKLHQLFQEERVENGVTNPSNPARRVKLKRRMNGFPFDSRTGKSYMEKVLQNPSPEHTVPEVSMSSSLVVLRTNDHNESGPDVVEFEPVSPRRDSMERKISPIMPNPSTYEQNEVFRDDKVREVSNSYPSTVSDEISYVLDDVNVKKDIHVGGESKTEDSFGYESDGVSCEIDNYVDAPSTMGSEVDTDSELRGKSDFTSSLVKTQPSYANDDLHTHSSDSHSTAEPTMSDEGNNSSKKETSSFSSSGSLGNSAENPHPDNLLSARMSSADIDLVDDASSYQKTSDGDFSVDRHLNHGVPDYTCTNKDTITSPRSDIEQLPSSLFCSSDSVPMLSHSDSEDVVREDMTRAREIEDVAFTLNDEDRKTIIDPLCSPSVLDPEFQSGYDYLISRENVDDEPNAENLPHTSTVSEIIGHKDSSAAMSLDFLHEDDSDPEDLTQVENSASSNMSNALSQSKYDVPETNFTEIPGAGKLDDDASELTEKVFSECPDLAANDVVNLSREVSEVEKLTDKLDKGDSNIFNDDSNCVSYLMEVSHDKELSEASLSNAEEHHSSSSIDNQVSSENIILPSAENSPDWPEDVIDSHDRDVVVVEEESAINESCDVLGLQGPEVTDDLFTKDSAAIGRTSSTPEILEEEAGLVDSVEDDGINLYTDPIGVEVVDDLVSTDIKSLNDYACEVEQLETADTDSANTDRNNSLTVGPHKWVEVHTPENSDRDELEDDSNSLSGSQREPGLLEEVGQGEAASSDSTSSAFCYGTDNGLLKLEASVDSNVAHSLDFVDDTTTELLQVQRGFDGEQGTAQQSVPSPIDSKIEELVSEEKMELQNDQLNEELLDSQEISLGQSPILAADPQQMPDHDDDREEDNNSGAVVSLVNYASPPSFPPSNISYETNEINLDELPPLPPLPPVQWRMGKLLQASPVTGEQTMNHESLTAITSLPNGFTDAISTSHEQMDHSLVQITPKIASKEEKLQRELSSFYANATNETTELQPEIENEPVQPTTSTNAISSLEDTNHSLIQIDLENAPSDEKLENALNNEKVENVCTMDKKIDLQPEIDNEQQHPTASHNDCSSSLEEMNDSSVQINLETVSEQEKVQLSSSSSEANVMPETKIIPHKVENEQLKLLLPFTARELPVPAVEDGVSNGTRLKVPRPPNPLFEDVAALDKSKLRKVTERVRPQIQKVDERVSLLEQIRTKSFNLKPALASRPCIRGPRTNLKVAAILEKANQIRQALAGSDEDDEDNWSDS